MQTLKITRQMLQLEFHFGNGNAPMNTYRYPNDDLPIKVRALAGILLNGDFEGNIEIAAATDLVRFPGDSRTVIFSGHVKVAGSITALSGTSLQFDGDLHAGGSITAESITVRGNLVVEGDIVSKDDIEVGWTLSAGGDVTAARYIDAVESITAGKSIRAGESINTYGSIKAGRDVVASGTCILAGGSIVAGDDIKAGTRIRAGREIISGHGIIAGWGVQAGHSITAKWIDVPGRIFAGLSESGAPAQEDTEIRAEIRSGTIAYGTLQGIQK